MWCVCSVPYLLFHNFSRQIIMIILPSTEQFVKLLILIWLYGKTIRKNIILVWRFLYKVQQHLNALLNQFYYLPVYEIGTSQSKLLFLASIKVGFAFHLKSNYLNKSKNTDSWFVG